MKKYNKILEAINRGIKFALDDFEDNEDIQGQVNSKVKYAGGMNEYLDLMNEVVDLGLPSGTLWCKYNLDVDPNLLSKAKDWYGKYYAWGELEGNKTNRYGEIYIDWHNYKFRKDYDKLSKYCHNKEDGYEGYIDNLTLLESEDDAAYQNKYIGNFKFHIPTKEQCEELINYTKNYLVYNYNPNKLVHNPEDDGGIQGLNGRIFEGKNKKQLFIPMTGYCIYSNFNNVGSVCNLWSSSLCIDGHSCAWKLFFNSNEVCMYIDYRYDGYSIRPVINL